MSTIEQAAKRLEQLRQAGVDTAAMPGASDAGVVAPVAPEALPLRVARELEAQGGSVAARADRRTETPLPAATPVLAQNRVEIDLARLSANGYITTDELDKLTIRWILDVLNVRELENAKFFI